MKRLAFVLLVACSDPAPAPVIEPEPEPTAPPVEARPEPIVEPPAAPTPSANVMFGSVHLVAPRRWADGPHTVLIELPDAPQPSGPVVGTAELHHAYWSFREIAVEPTPTEPVVVVQTYPRIATCEGHVRRARRLHATLRSDDDPSWTGEPTTFLALELADCLEGGTAIVGVPIAEVTVRSLRRTALPDPVPVELVDLVRDADSMYGAPPAAADYRMLVLPNLGITIVAGSLAHVVRDGRRWSERWGGDLDVLIEAGGHAFFEVSSVADGWASSLDCFHPRFVPGSCEVTDASGTPTNVRSGPSGRSPVVTTTTTGTTLTADDHVGSWFHVRTTPPGWVHESAVRCTELAETPQPCP
jgi:hypothetical protein